MDYAEEISSWKVKDLRDWLDKESINYSKTAKKQELIDLVVNAAEKGAVIERGPSESDVSKLTIDGLIQWLSERNIDLPASKQRKQFYLDLVEAMSQSAPSDKGYQSPTITERLKQPPSTTPRASRASVKKTPSRAKSSSPPSRRRSTRRKLIDMPDSSSSNEDDEDTTESRPEQTEVAPITSCPDNSRRGRVGSTFMLFVIFAMISAYIAYLAKSLLPHLNW